MGGGYVGRRGVAWRVTWSIAVALACYGLRPRYNDVVTADLRRQRRRKFATGATFACYEREGWWTARGSNSRPPHCETVSGSISASGGNSGHALFAVDLPNDQTSDAVIKRALDVLAARFSDDGVHVDSNVHNPARILDALRDAQRGLDADRPIGSWIDSRHICVSCEQLDAVAQLASAGPHATTTRTTTDAGTVLDSALLSTARLVSQRPRRRQNAVSCPCVSAHSGESSLTEACLFSPREPGAGPPYDGPPLVEPTTDVQVAQPVRRQRWRA